MENLDPTGKITEKEAKEVLTSVGLFSHIEGNKKIFNHGLKTKISDDNNTFSLGQKQLLCLARAIVKHSKILVLDEATANVDLVTDNLIQKTLKESFKDSTVIVVAHRLATIIDSDRILVMSDGKAEEYDHPYKLLTRNEGDQMMTNVDGHFAKMVAATGQQSGQTLFEIAKNNYKN
jgi:ATP-binding cassette subfamily C (CFTR/MRP) protein 4